MKNEVVGSTDSTPPLGLGRPLTVYHIGGTEGYGPVESLIPVFSESMRLVVFEAREGTEDVAIAERMNKDGIRTQVVNRCVLDKVGKTPFHVNKFPLSSSVFPPAAAAINEHVAYSYWDCHTWGQNVELETKLELETVSIDELVASGALPSPDVISIDAQGAELLILNGAKQCIRDSVLAVFSEIEFSEIYAGQGLFCDQMGFLRKHGFRLADIVNTQYWWQGPAMGDGFLTVGEALFLRRMDEAVKGREADFRAMLLKLAGIAYAFNRLSLAFTITENLLKACPDIVSGRSGDQLIDKLRDLHDDVKSNLPNYEADSRFFLDRSAKQALAEANSRRGVLSRLAGTRAGRKVMSALRRI